LDVFIGITADYFKPSFAHQSKPLFLSSISVSLFSVSKNHFTKTTAVFHGLVVRLPFLNAFGASAMQTIAMN
jgi:hypothetical protein